MITSQSRRYAFMIGSTPGSWVDGEAYEAFIGRWSRVVAGEFVAWLSVPINSVWLDVGCGTGALTQAILDRCHPSGVDACDLSAAFVEHARRSVADPRASFSVADACRLAHQSGAYNAVVSGLVLNALPDQPRAISEMARAANAGGLVGVYVWDFDGAMQVLRYFWDAASALDPHADEVDTSRFAICKPDRLAAALRRAGLRNVAVRAIDAPATFRDFDDYWMPFQKGEARSQAHVQSLSQPRRAELRELLRSRLPIAADGSISLVARAWAAKGHKEEI